MTLNKRFGLSLALAALSALTAVGADAATVARGTFTLPAQAYWNNMLLQPGEYSLSIDRTISGVPTIALKGEGITATFFAPLRSGDLVRHSALKLDEINGTYVVRELDAAPLGEGYRFAVSKTVKNQMARGESVVIPVVAGQ